MTTTMSKIVLAVVPILHMAQHSNAAPTLFYVGVGNCLDNQGRKYDSATLYSVNIDACDTACIDDNACLGFDYVEQDNTCKLRFSDGTMELARYTDTSSSGTFGTGNITSAGDDDSYTCYSKIQVTEAPTLSPSSGAPTTSAPSTGSPTNSPTTPPPTTGSPSSSPTTSAPSESPTTSPPTTGTPSTSPTVSPTDAPTTVWEGHDAVCKAIKNKKACKDDNDCYWTRGRVCRTKFTKSPTMEPTMAPTIFGFWEKEEAFCNPMSLTDCRSNLERCRWAGKTRSGMCRSRADPIPTDKPTASPISEENFCAMFTNSATCLNRSNRRCTWDKDTCVSIETCNCNNVIVDPISEWKEPDGDWLSIECERIPVETYCQDMTHGLCRWTQGSCGAFDSDS